MKLTYGKCINCGKRIKFENFVCENCYHIYFMRVKEYLEKYPLADMKTLQKGTNLPMQLINLFYENGDIEKYINELNGIKEEEVAAKEEEQSREDRLRLALQLQQGIINDTNGQKVVEAKAKMRFLQNNNKK